MSAYLRVMLVACVVICPAKTIAETFDFDGGATLACVCPSNNGSNDCAIKSSSTQTYSVSIFVNKGLNIDLAEKCFEKRDRQLCCDDPRSTYSGTVSQTCEGRPCP